jgi:peptidoglycan/LPS O-acetylase OafA/YrhL
MTINKERGHIAALDGLRGIAILMVLLLHFYDPRIFDTSQNALIVMGRAIGPLRYGVQLFFLLSGFLITGILLDAKGQPGYLKRFFARRILRIFPLYYGSLVVVFLLLPWLVEFDGAANAILAKQVWAWSYMVNWPVGFIWDDSTVFMLGHFWSLAVEEHFYLVWPLLIALLPKNRVIHAAMGLVLLGIAARFFGSISEAHSILEWSTITKVDGLALGAALAAAVRTPDLAARLPTGRIFRFWVTGFCCLFLVYITLPRLVSKTTIVQVFGESVVVGLGALVLLGAIRCRPASPVHRLLTLQQLTTLGKYSYGLYVIHGLLRPCFLRVFGITGWRGDTWNFFAAQCAYWLLTIFICLGLAWLSFHCFEKHFLKLKRFFENPSPMIAIRNPPEKVSLVTRPPARYRWPNTVSGRR